MKLTKTIFLTILIFIANISVAQDSSNANIPKSSKYLNFLLHPDSTSQNHLFTCNYQYLYTNTNKELRTTGGILSGGINLARLFNRKIVLGVCFDIKGIKGFTQQHFSQQFINDFNSSFITTYSNSHDSIRGYVVKDAVNSNKRVFGGNYLGSMGIMISLFPQKYGGLMLMVKKGYRSYPIFFVNLENEFGEDDHPNLYLPENYSFELSCKPYSFFKNSYINQTELKGLDFLKSLTITAYYERLNLKKASFKGLPINQIVNSSFLNKYAIIENYGLKIGFSFY